MSFSLAFSKFYWFQSSVQSLLPKPYLCRNATPTGVAIPGWHLLTVQTKLKKWQLLETDVKVLVILRVSQSRCGYSHLSSALKHQVPTLLRHSPSYTTNICTSGSIPIRLWEDMCNSFGDTSGMASTWKSWSVLIKVWAKGCPLVHISLKLKMKMKTQYMCITANNKKSIFIFLQPQYSYWLSTEV